MAQILKDGHLDRILKENPKKLICVLFANPGYPPCEKARLLWDRLTPKYPTCLFIYVECDKCQTDARRQEIKQIPTFIFYKNQSNLNKIIGVEEEEIIQFIEKNRTAGAFEGSSHRVGPPSEYQQQQPAPISQQNNKPQPKSQPQNSVAEVRSELLNFGFPLSIIDKAIQATNFGTVDDCMDYITQEQEKEEKNQSNTQNATDTQQSANSPNTNAPNTQITASSNPTTPPTSTNPSNPTPSGPQSAGPKRMLSPAAKAMKEQLLSFGYQEEEIDKAIGIVGPDSIDRLIDCISRLQNGEDSTEIAQQQQQQQKQKLSPEELNKRAEELKQRAVQKEIEKQKAAPKLAAQRELERRKEVLMQVELKRQQDERKRQLEMEAAAKQKIQDKIERERVKKMIAQQRGQNAQNQTAQPKPSQNPTPHKTANECTLKIVIPGDKDIILKFSPEAKFEEVDQKVRSERPNVVGNTTYTSNFPPLKISRIDFDKTVTELGLMPRTMLTLSLN